MLCNLFNNVVIVFGVGEFFILKYQPVFTLNYLYLYINLGMAYCYADEPAWYCVIILFVYAVVFIPEGIDQICNHVHENIFDEMIGYQVLSYGMFFAVPTLSAMFYPVSFFYFTIPAHLGYVILLVKYARSWKVIGVKEPRERKVHLVAPSKFI